MELKEFFEVGFTPMRRGEIWRKGERQERKKKKNWRLQESTC